jgi:hypothetical protein
MEGLHYNNKEIKDKSDNHSIFYCLLGKPRNECRGWNTVGGIAARPRPPNLWNSCPKTAGGIYYCLNFVYFAQPASLYCEKYVYIYTPFWQSRDCIWTNVATIWYCQKSANLRSVEWIFITGVPAWRWMAEYVTVDKRFYSLPFKKEVVPTPVTSKFSSLSHSFRRPLLET